MPIDTNEIGGFINECTNINYLKNLQHVIATRLSNLGANTSPAPVVSPMIASEEPQTRVQPRLPSIDAMKEAYTESMTMLDDLEPVLPEAGMASVGSPACEKGSEPAEAIKPVEEQPEASTAPSEKEEVKPLPQNQGKFSTLKGK